MKQKRTFYGLLTAVVVLSAFALQMAQAQPGGGRDRGNRGNRAEGGGRQRVDWRNMSAEERQKMMTQMRERFNKQRSDAQRKELGATEEEYKTLETLIKAVTDIQQEMQPPANRRGGRNPWGGNTRTRTPRAGAREGAATGAKTAAGAKEGAAAGKTDEAAKAKAAEEEKKKAEAEAAKSPMVKASENLQKVIADAESTPEQIKAALDAYRAERAKLTTKLAEARMALKTAVNPKQEAILVAKGILE